VSTLASIVDEETANDGEKPMIAGLYLNRLRRGMLLQADPTVKFAQGDFALRRILYSHLDVDNPYNTYRYAGLPPGPIRIPSVAGLDAVLNAVSHPYIYMCAKEDFSGTHNFAVTLSEHMRNARRYVRALNERGIK
ncbi:MAG: endolytic transglycosylase MltG, partial [Bacteroidaceae bacterium]|nr:endolytic transglycosylase MltG [Bacteroidaceae bacterium]